MSVAVMNAGSLNHQVYDRTRSRAWLNETEVGGGGVRQPRAAESKGQQTGRQNEYFINEEIDFRLATNFKLLSRI
jgi:hypothetical protein